MSNIDTIGTFEALQPTLPSVENKANATDSDFATVFKAGVQALNDKQVQANTLTEQLAAGEDVELHDVMIASQEADIALRMATQLRNQALEAYREITRMPV